MLPELEPLAAEDYRISVVLPVFSETVAVASRTCDERLPHGIDVMTKALAPKLIVWARGAAWSWTCVRTLAGSGLGGSSALTAAIIGALARHTGQSLDAYDLAELNYEIERHDLRIAGGKQDQYATAFGGFNLIEFHADRVLVNPLSIDRNILNDLESHLLLCYTGRVRADLGLVSQQMKMYREGRAATHEGLHRLYELVFEMKEALLKGRLTEFGELLHEAYLAKIRMNPNVAAGTIADKLYEGSALVRRDRRQAARRGRRRLSAAVLRDGSTARDPSGAGSDGRTVHRFRFRQSGFAVVAQQQPLKSCF